MAIFFNNSVANILGTPGAISGVLANQPAAADQAEGTLYFSTDTLEIYQAIAGSWGKYTGGGGGGGLTTANNGLSVSSGGGVSIAQLGGTLLFNTTIDADTNRFQITNVGQFDLADSSNTVFHFEGQIVSILNTYGGADKGLYMNYATESYSLHSNFFGLFIDNNIAFLGYNDVANLDKKGISIELNTYYPNILIGDNSVSDVGNNTLFILDDSGQRIYTSFATNNDGIFLQPGRNKIGTFWNNNTFLEIDDINQIVSLNNNFTYKGIYFDITNKTYTYGEPDCYFLIERKPGAQVMFTYYDTAWQGFYFNLESQTSYFGNNDHRLTLEQTQAYYWQNSIINFSIDFGTDNYYLGKNYENLDLGIIISQFDRTVIIGDKGNIINGTTFGIDDYNQYLTASANLLVGTSGSVSGQHLKINVGGTDYVIELKNP